ncbi:MAG TPA: septum formation initiator family protein [Nitrospiria bacterium]|nr:septum formation initiator family protein [Nitrospiria bacterium]
MARGNRSRGEIERAALFRRRVFLLVSLLGGGYLLLSLLFSDMGLLKHRTMLQFKRQMEEEQVSLTEENERLRQEIEALRSDPAAIERAARERLGMARPGEIVYRFYKKSD